MAYKTLVAVVTDPDTDLALLTAAADTARRENAHLDVYCLGIDQTRYEPLPPAAALSVADLGAKEARATADSLSVWAKEVLSNRYPSAIVQAIVLPHLGLDAGIARLARYADLILCSRPYGPEGGAGKVATLEAALFGSGAPVVVLGQSKDLADTPMRVLLAWDESDEAMTAIRSAISLMQAATHVDVVMVDPPTHSPERSDPGGALSVMLARHGIRAEVSILAKTLPRVADCLIRFARERGCDMIVMGAYGHSRLREAMVGGPTRDMLESAEVSALHGALMLVGRSLSKLERSDYQAAINIVAGLHHKRLHIRDFDVALAMQDDRSVPLQGGDLPADCFKGQPKIVGNGLSRQRQFHIDRTYPRHQAGCRPRGAQ